MGLVKRLINMFTGGHRRPATATTGGAHQTSHTSTGGLSGLIRRILR
jgi:hypothetical protein